MPEYQAQVSQQARSKIQCNTPISKIFMRYDVVETCYHFLCQRIDLHLCDDPGREFSTLIFLTINSVSQYNFSHQSLEPNLIRLLIFFMYFFYDTLNVKNIFYFSNVLLVIYTEIKDFYCEKDCFYFSWKIANLSIEKVGFFSRKWRLRFRLLTSVF